MSFPGKSVLVVDDTELQRLMLRDLLLKMGVEKVYTAKDGLEGVRSARYYKPDLVLLDLQMPNVDGFETCQKIRIFANKVTMPVIIITGQDKTRSLEQIYELGANDYFEKPYNKDEITNRIKFYLEYGDVLQRLSSLEQHIQKDLDIARSIQERSLPDFDKTKEVLAKNGLDFSCYVGEERLGGDSWGLLHLDCGTPVFFLFDVTGHGINAAINNSFITSLTNLVFSEFQMLPAKDFSPADFLKTLNEIVCEHIQAGTFCAPVCAIFDGGIGRYAGAAMPPLRIIDIEKGTFEELPCIGLPMGISIKNFEPTEGTFNLDAKTLFLMLTDGLTESMTDEHDREDLNKYGKLLPGERLLNLCMSNMKQLQNDTTASDNLNMIIDTFKEHKYNLDGDDTTILAIRKLNEKEVI